MEESREEVNRKMQDKSRKENAWRIGGELANLLVGQVDTEDEIKNTETTIIP